MHARIESAVRACRVTEIPAEMVQEFLEDISERFNALTYNLLKNNCNNFSDEMASFLVGKGIPVCLVVRLQIDPIILSSWRV